MAKLGEDARVLANAAGIFAERGVQDVVQAVFDAPVPTDGAAQSVRRGVAGRQIVRRLFLARFETTARRIEALHLAPDFDHDLEVVVPAGKGQTRTVRCSIRLRWPLSTS